MRVQCTKDYKQWFKKGEMLNAFKIKGGFEVGNRIVSLCLSAKTFKEYFRERRFNIPRKPRKQRGKWMMKWECE